MFTLSFGGDPDKPHDLIDVTFVHFKFIFCLSHRPVQAAMQFVFRFSPFCPLYIELYMAQ